MDNVVFEDVEMVDVEEGEIFAENEVESYDAKRDSDHSEQRKTNGKKKKTRRNKSRSRSRSTPNTTDISRFVPNVCRHLKERKSYLIWAAVACLGASALSDLVKEVDAIQACGGIKTVDGNRFRSGGGILWNILKHRDPKAYKEIMNRGKEFEKQFKPQKINQEPVKNIEPSLAKVTSLLKDLILPQLQMDRTEILCRTTTNNLLQTVRKKNASVYQFTIGYEFLYRMLIWLEMNEEFFYAAVLYISL